jgi:DNA-binding response OmpR family regulator
MAKILLVTNNAKAIAPWQIAAAREGYALDTALSGGEALGRAVSGRPGLILLARIETSPEVFVQQLRQNPASATIPVVHITPEEETAPDATLASVRSRLSARRILIAEDDRQMANLLAMVLKGSGYEVKLTHDGVEALREIKAWHPHILVLDIMLPIIDGFHVCQTMNEDHSFDPVPKVMIISGRSSDWDQNLGEACGAEHYLVKPFSNTVFLQKIQEMITSLPA